ncbi:hypothetical protein ASPCAL03229 [Aspergillus calidoustus]|uniref:Uncharacterized protein n=1 Tax=Aspergillus calidoustus TaxID=454130 RepID=A0A0U5HH88_ASPCI|nr:hypothetical protein ASPCAL03229 [Aspergillus calidoustus]
MSLDSSITRKPRGYAPAHLANQESEPQGFAHVKYKRHPVYSRTEWLYETTTISALTTFCSAALMHSVSQFIGQLKWLYFKDGLHKLSHFEIFDEASRGPWGSIFMVTTVKWNLATIGALITIFRLSFAPLAQQVIEFVPQNVARPDGINVAFGYSHAFQRPRASSVIIRSLRMLDSVPQDPEMQSAVLQGLYGISSLGQFNCPGLCQWTKPYISLGFKSKCRNVTQESLQTQSCNATEGPITCDMTTPGGIGLATHMWRTSYATSYVMNVTSGILAEPERDFPEIAKFAVYRSSPDLNYEQRFINVTECSLSLTAYQLQNATASGSTGLSFGRVTEVNFGVENPWHEGSEGDVGSQIRYTNASTVYHLDIPSFVIGSAEVIALSNFLTSPIIVSEFIEGHSNMDVNRGLAPFITGNVDVAERFERMSTAMTDRVRNGPNAQLALGERIDSVQYVRIRWVYLIGPTAIEVVALMLAVITIYRSRESRGVPLWKTSALAVLACRHDRDGDLVRSTIRDMKEMDKLAGKVEVRLQ